MTTAICTESDVDQIFGDAHVTSWATQDPADAGATITARKVRACLVATVAVEDLLRATAYAVPALNADAATPITLVDLAARIAGLWLYEAQGADGMHSSGIPIHRYSFMREDVRRRMEEIRLGTVILDAVTGG